MSGRAAYAVFMLGALVAAIVVRRFQPDPGGGLADLALGQRLGVALAAFIGGSLGAKLPFLVTGEGLLGDGKTVLTGMIGGYALVEATKIALGIRVKTGDSFALPLAVAMAVGRWGCFLNPCCWGTPSGLPWAVDFGDGIARHPAQLYEILFHVTMAVVLWRLAVGGAFARQRLKLYLMAYAGFRFAVEFVRPELEGPLGLSIYQWIAAGMLAALALQWTLDARTFDTPGAPC